MKPLEGYRIESFVPEQCAYDSDFHRAMRIRLEDLMHMQGFEQKSRVEVRVLSHDELADCPLRPGYRIVEAFVDVSEYDAEVPMDVETPQQDVRVDVPPMHIAGNR